MKIDSGKKLPYAPVSQPCISIAPCFLGLDCAYENMCILCIWKYKHETEINKNQHTSKAWEACCQHHRWVVTNHLLLWDGLFQVCHHLSRDPHPFVQCPHRGVGRFLPTVQQRGRSTSFLPTIRQCGRSACFYWLYNNGVSQPAFTDRTTVWSVNLLLLTV